MSTQIGHQRLSWSTRLNRTITLSERYHIDGNHLVFYRILCRHWCSEKIFFWIKFDNLLFKSFHTFGCKQTVSKMFRDFSVFATIGDAHGEHPVKIKIVRTMAKTPLGEFLNWVICFYDWSTSSTCDVELSATYTRLLIGSNSRRIGNNTQYCTTAMLYEKVRPLR